MHFDAISVQNNVIEWDSKSYQEAPIYLHLKEADDAAGQVCIEIESTDSGESYHVNLRDDGVRNLSKLMPAFPDNLHVYLDFLKNDRFFNGESLQRWVVFK
jgi:hypothetical protein